MSRLVLRDEFHLSIQVACDLPEVQVEALRRILASGEFRSALRAAVTQVVAARPELSPFHVRLSL
jgi:hypothetical protein